MSLCPAIHKTLKNSHCDVKKSKRERLKEPRLKHLHVSATKRSIPEEEEEEEEGDALVTP